MPIPDHREDAEVKGWKKLATIERTLATIQVDNSKGLRRENLACPDLKFLGPVAYGTASFVESAPTCEAAEASSTDTSARLTPFVRVFVKGRMDGLTRGVDCSRPIRPNFFRCFGPTVDCSPVCNA